jgi:peptidoglycan/xylan/chitin deacetylase (PgdA/CDA1 family)
LALNCLRASAIALVALLGFAPSALGAQTTVSLAFDDGIATQNFARTQLAAHGMHGTFYINSGNIEAPDNPYYMSWADVDALNADGNEIAGHTVDHKRLSTLTANQQHHEICDDAAALRTRGYTITDFAYPFGDGAQLQSVRQALSDCGYQTGRKFGDLRGPDCPDQGCATSESIPPADPYALNTTGWKQGALTLQDLEGFITQAENNGGGWVPVVFHDICNGCDDASVTQSTFQSFLDWLQPRAANGTIVKTVREVMNPGYVRPKGASPFRVPLVPAYEACTSPSSTHGSPLAFGSCPGPDQSSAFLTIGSPDANGQFANSTGSLVLHAIPGDQSTPADEADVRIDLSITDVRELSDLSDYTGQLDAEPGIRLTDRLNGPQQVESATVSDFSLGFAVPCTATSSTTAGSTCSVSTTADAVQPGMVKEGARAIWALGQVFVDDGGPDGVASTPDNTHFLAQGIFTP